MKRNGNLQLPALPPLASPEQLAVEAAAAVRDILAEAASANTARSYASALRYCAAWYQGRYGRPLALPLPEAVVIQFIVDHLARRGETALAWDCRRHWMRRWWTSASNNAGAAEVEHGQSSARGAVQSAPVASRGQPMRAARRPSPDRAGPTRRRQAR